MKTSEALPSIPVDFAGKTIRSTQIDGVIWFVAKDVFERLDMTWHANRLDIIPDDWKLKDKIVLQGQMRATWLINEQAFYRIVHRSDHPDVIEFCNTVAQFGADLRNGRITMDDVEQLREGYQGLLFKLTKIKSQKKVNHKRNQTPGMGTHISEWWREGYRKVTGMEFEEKMNELREKGVPEWRLKKSGQDGLRFFAEDYGHAMAMADRSQLSKEGWSDEQIDELLEEGRGYYKIKGRIEGLKYCYARHYKPKPRKSYDHPGQQHLF